MGLRKHSDLLATSDVAHPLTQLFILRVVVQPYVVRMEVLIGRDVGDEVPPRGYVSTDLKPSPGATVGRTPPPYMAYLSANKTSCSKVVRTLVMRLNGDNNLAQVLALLDEWWYGNCAADRLPDGRVGCADRQFTAFSNGTRPILGELQDIPNSRGWEGCGKRALSLKNIVRISRDMP